MISDQPKELRVIRWGIIIMLIVTFAGIGLQEYFHLPEHEDNASSNATSGIEEITLNSIAKPFDYPKDSLYINSGFQVLKPNNNWEARSVTEVISPQKLRILESKGFVDGIYLDENHDKKFMITVFDIPSDFLLDSYIDSQISQMSANTKVEIPKKQISPSNDWANFAMSIPTEKWNYGEQVLFIKENKLFMLQYTGQNPDKLSNEKKSEYLSIIESFKVI